jgi:hypothetical protein
MLEYADDLKKPNPKGINTRVDEKKPSLGGP